MLTLNQEIFIAEYAKQLRKAIIEHPEEYGYPESEAEFVVARMTAAIERGSFNHSSRTFRGTCKAIGIKYTRTAILEFWRAQ